MIELYASRTPNVLKVMILLEEIEFAYRIEYVNVWKGEQFEQNFARLNPNSKVPTLVDTDGPEGAMHTVFESGAILIYLAEKSGHFLPKQGASRSDVFQWLMFQTAGIGPIGGQLNHFLLYAPERIDYARDRYLTEVGRLFHVMDGQLAKHPFVAGDDYSIADMAIFPWVANLSLRHGPEFPFLSLGSDELRNVARWYEAIARRPAVARAQARFDAIPSSLKEASPRELDRIFGRGAFSYEKTFPERPDSP